jgi:hypothetical protein
MTRRAAALALTLSMVCASCAPPLLKLPSGPGVAAPDANDAVIAATAACRPLTSISLEMAVSGSLDGRRIRGRLLAGLTRPGAVRLEAVAPAGQPVFVLTNGMGFVQSGANLLLPGDNRVLQRGQFDAVLEAVTGIPLDASTLFVVLTGCTPGPPLGATAPGAPGTAIGEDWRLARAGNLGAYDIYVHREKAGPWRLVAMSTRRAADGWRVEFGAFQNDLPRSLRLISVPSGRFDLQIALSQVELNPSLGPDVFTIQVPASASPITLDELKTSGPLGTNGR